MESLQQTNQVNIVSYKEQYCRVILYITILAPTAEPEEFSYTLEDTVVLFSWLQPIEAKRNGIIVSYTLTCTVGSNDILEYTIKAIKQSIYFGVYDRVTDYSCDILASTAAGDGPTASLSFTTGGIIIVSLILSLSICCFHNRLNYSSLPTIYSSGLFV